MIGIDTFRYSSEEILSLVIEDWHKKHDNTHMNFELTVEKDGMTFPRYAFKDNIIISAAQR